MSSTLMSCALAGNCLCKDELVHNVCLTESCARHERRAIERRDTVLAHSSLSGSQDAAKTLPSARKLAIPVLSMLTLGAFTLHVNACTLCSFLYSSCHRYVLVFSVISNSDYNIGDPISISHSWVRASPSNAHI